MQPEVTSPLFKSVKITAGTKEQNVRRALMRTLSSIVNITRLYHHHVNSRYSRRVDALTDDVSPPSKNVTRNMIYASYLSKGEQRGVKQRLDHVGLPELPAEHAVLLAVASVERCREMCPLKGLDDRAVSAQARLQVLHETKCKVHQVKSAASET